MRNIKIDGSVVKDADSDKSIKCPLSFNYLPMECNINCAWYSEDNWWTSDKGQCVQQVVAKCKDHVIGLLRIIESKE